MKAYATRKLLHKPEIDFFHYLMFHGKEIDEEPFGRKAGPCLGDEVFEQANLVRNVQQIPHVFEPGCHFVVSEEVKDRLCNISHVAFLPVCFHKVVDFPTWRPGDFSFEQNPEFQRVLKNAKIEELLHRLPDVPSLHGTLGRYYELVVARLSDIAPRYGSVQTFDCVIPMAVGWRQELQLSQDLLRDYPIVWSGHTVFNEQAFELISPYLDRDYFGVVELSVG